MVSLYQGPRGKVAKDSRGFTMRSRYSMSMLGLCLLIATMSDGSPAVETSKLLHGGVRVANDLSRASVLVRNDSVYFATLTGISALNSTNGKLFWTINAPGGGIDSGLTNVGLYLFFSGSNGDASCTKIYAIEATSGRVEWSKKHRSCLIWGDDSALYLQVQGGDDVLKVDADTGDNIWLSPGSSFRHISRLVIYDNRIYTDSRMLDDDDGQAIAQWPEGIDPNVLIVLDGRLYVGGSNGLLAALDASNADVIWKTGSLVGKDVISLAATEARVYAAAYRGSPLDTHDGIVVAYDASGGTPLWKYPLYSCCQELGREPLSIYGKKVYVVVPSDDKSGSELVALDAETGDRLWSYRNPKGLLGPVVASGPHVYIATIDNKLVAVNKKTGLPVWVYSPGVNE